MTTYPLKKRTEVSVLVMISYRLAKNCGIVVSPIDRYLGSKKIAVMTMASAARVSHAMTRIPCSQACPLRPTICSVDKLVRSKEPAMTPAVRLLPPKKYPSEVVSTVPQTYQYEMSATNMVNARKVITAIF